MKCLDFLYKGEEELIKSGFLHHGYSSPKIE